MKQENKEYIIRKYFEVKAMGWIKSNRKNNTGIGKTFEDYMGVTENNEEAPDLVGFEIKSHRDISQSYVTLFTKVPDFPRGANRYLTQIYGVPYEFDPNVKKLHTSMFATKFNTFHGKYSFRLINDRVHEQIRIGIYDLATHELIDKSVGYNYKSIDNVLKKKLKNLFYVAAERKFYNNDIEGFYFNHAEIYSEPSLEKFLYLIDSGQIMFDIRIGSYKSGPNYGQPHDHGSGFRILDPNLYLLYDKKEIVD